MKKKISREKAYAKITNFFENSNFTPKELKKIKRLAMNYQIKLRYFRKKFCKYCLNPLEGKIRISKKYRIRECERCHRINRLRLH